jgi:transcriptional regulator with XRE-family HTH domain
MDTSVQSQMESDNNAPSNPSGRKWPGTNSVRFYREKKDFTLQEVARALNTKHQTIQKLETGVMKLTPEWADRIGAVLRVPARFLAFSNEPNGYSWAVKPVPIMGLVDSEMRIETAGVPLRRIGVPDAAPGLRALELGKGSMPGFEGWVILYDEDSRERVSARTIELQEQNTKFLIRTHDGETWWRRFVSSARRGFYHLESLHKTTVYDVEIEWVCAVLGFEPPGQDLPPFDE